MTLKNCLLPIVTVALLLAITGPLSGRAGEVAFYVAPDGRDGWLGMIPQPNAAATDGPLATIGQAQQAIRRLKKQGPLPGPVKVYIAGVHRISEPIVFTAEDSGTELCPITYQAQPGREAVFSGGQPITGWKKGAGQCWTAEIPAVRAGKWYFRQLFVNGRRACRARTPNEGFLRVTGLSDTKTKGPWEKGTTGLRFEPGDIRPWADLHNVEVVVFHSWNTSRVRIESVDVPGSTVAFTGPTVFRPLAWDPKQRYYVENAIELLDAPGEWYLDRQTGLLSYWPLPGEDMTRAEVVAPRLTELLRFDGDPDKGCFIDWVSLLGLSLEHADWSLPDTGYGDPQAAVTVPAVVSARGVRHCTIERCEIAHVGNYGLWLSRGCKQNRIAECHIWDLGAGAVRIGEPVKPPTDVAESTGNLVTNNYLHDGCEVYAGAVGLWLAQSSHNTISHNEIHSFNYSGMSIGWNWDESPTRTLGNLIEYNHVHHVVRGMLSDAGGIYTLGTQTGTIIRDNIFHDIFPYRGSPAMAWGIYFDQGSNGLLVENNIVYRTLTGGIMNLGNPGNIVRNNIFALSAWQAAWRWSFQHAPPTVVTRNIFYLTQGDLFSSDAGRTDTQSKWDYNLYWRTDGQPMLFYEEEFSRWQAKGLDRHGRVADPGFVDAAHGDFRLKPGSPALELGFRPIDASKCGLVGRPEWVELPRRAKLAQGVLPPVDPPLPPVPIDDSFEQTGVGQPPADATLSEEGHGDSIRVCDEMAAGGRHSLKVTDAPGLKYSFNPHMYYAPHFGEGTATLSFDLRLEAHSLVGHEWRDARQPYGVGPSMLFDASRGLLVAGKPLAVLPLGTWIHVEIVCPLGGKPTGTFDLTLAWPGHSPKVFRQIACGSPKFNRLEWLGFTSLATEKTAFYLDNVKLSTKKP